MFSNQKNPKLPQKNKHNFSCENCDFNSSNKKDYERHLQTIKHKNKFCQPVSTKNPNLPLENTVFTCLCGKIYKDKSGIWRHKKKCIKESIPGEIKSEECSEEGSEEKYYKVLPTNNEIIEILKVQMLENQELRKFMMEQQKQMIDQMMEIASKSNVTNTINSNNNCNNKSFNLNFFLNEQCKDALNINEFVDSIKMQLLDLENFAHLGYADGVSNIFVKGINALDIHKRPIHCSDSKREVLYIKNNDEWMKESDDKPLIRSAIKKVAFKNIKQINDWVKENPGCKDPSTKKYDQYNKIVMNAMSGVTEQEQNDNIDKIVKNVTKAVAIDKYALR